jgi:hypothetical protein
MFFYRVMPDVLIELVIFGHLLNDPSILPNHRLNKSAPAFHGC